MKMRATRTTSSRDTRRRGFTLVELTLGLIVTAMVSGAVGAFLLAVTRCWDDTANVQSGAVRASQFRTRLAQRIQDAKCIGYWRNGGGGGAKAVSPANVAFIFWQGDTNSDGQMQASELGVVAFNPADQTIDLYTLAAGAPDTICTASDLKNSSAIVDFIGNATAIPLVRGVETAALNVMQEQSETVAPMVTWHLALHQPDGTLSDQSCVVSMRAPSTPP
jgi:type II secretory pathway pseudopilin PulG